MTSPSFAFIAKNLHLFGFDSPVNGLVQASRELLDNSIDACRRKQMNFTSTSPMHISIGINVDPDFSLFLEVSDNGIGLQNAGDTFQPFATDSTHTQSSDLGRIGKYGVGLSATLLFSYLNTHHLTQVVSKTADNNAINAIEVGIQLSTADNVAWINRHVDPTQIQGVAMSMNQAIHCADNHYSGTSIKLKMPTLSTLDHLHAALKKIESYITAICLNPTLVIQVDYTMQYATSVPTMHQFKSIGLLCSTLYNPPTLPHLALSLPPSVEEAARHFLSLYPATNLLRVDAILDINYNSTFSNATTTPGSSSTLHSLLFISSYSPPSDSTPSTTSPLKHPNEILLRIYRYVNHKPLYDQDTNLSCSILKTIRKIKYSGYNIQLLLYSNAEGEAGAGDVRGDMVEDCSVWFIMKSILEDVEYSLDTMNMTGNSNVVVDFYLYYGSKEVCYGNMKKSYLQSLCCADQKVFSQAIEQMVGYLSDHSLCAHSLISPLQLKKRQCKMLSDAVGKMIRFTNKKEDVEDIDALLGSIKRKLPSDSREEEDSVEDMLYKTILHLVP